MADDGENASAVATSLERLARLLRAADYRDGLNPAQWEALRYLARANRFSNSPGALTRYLGATKGTISQTLISLERKGYIAKSQREDEKRSVRLTLTERGREALSHDPWSRLAAAAGELGGKTRRRMAKGLHALLDGELKRGGHPSFGVCKTCRFFRENGHDGQHLCMLFEEPVSEAERRLICSEHEAA